MPKVQYHMDQPLADPSCIALYFVTKLASEHVKVVLSGEGAAELFGGYTCYNDPRVFKVYQKIVPYFLRRAIGWVCKKLPDIKGRDYLIRAIHPLEKRYIGNAYMYDEKQKKAILKNPAIATDPARMTRRLFTRARRYDDETKMQYLDINMWMVGDILLKADRMSMANSLELRVPFLDKEVFNVAATIPTPLRVNKMNTKYAMRKAAARHLPEEVAEKPKLGFPVPTRVWLKDEHYYNVVKDMFTSPTAEKFFNTGLLLDYLDEHIEEKEDNSRKIWTIYVFLVWYQIYFGAVEPLEPAQETAQAETAAEENATENATENAVEDDNPDGGTKIFTPVKEGDAAPQAEEAQEAEGDAEAAPEGEPEIEEAAVEAAEEVSPGFEELFSGRATHARRVNVQAEEEEKPLSFGDDIDADDFFANLTKQLKEAEDEKE